MNTQTVLRKAWHMLWQYRMLWLFGAIFALVSVNTPYFLLGSNPDEMDEWTRLKITESTTIQIPGPDVTIDFTTPEGVRVIIGDRATWTEFNALVDELDRELSINLWPILIEFGVILAVVLALSIVARYVTETALIRMAAEADATGQRVGLWAGVRKGFSLRAGRLFILDLVIGVAAVLAFAGALGIAAAPILLAIGRQEAIILIASVSTLGLLVAASYLGLAASTVLSLVLQPVRRACVLENQSLPASVRHGLNLVRQNFASVGVVWLIWMGIRLAWVPVGILTIVLLAPVLLLTTVAGVAVGSLPAFLVGTIAALFTGGWTPWIMGTLAGIPVVIVVMVSPLALVGGLVEVYQSCLWTLAYRGLKPAESRVPTPAPRTAPQTARGAAD